MIQMKDTNKTNIFSISKPLYVSSGYGVLSALFCLVIPFLPFYELSGSGKRFSAFTAFFKIIASISGAKNFEVFFYYIVSNWFVFAILAFSAFFVVRIVFAASAVLKAKQFTVFYTDKIYLLMFKISCLFFLVGFVINVLYSEMEIFETYRIIPTAYVYLYGIISFIGIVINIICKNICAPLRANKGNLYYMIGKTAIYFFFVLLAMFSSVMLVKRGEIVYAASFFSSVTNGTLFIQKGSEFFIDIRVFKILMSRANCGPAFMYLVVSVITADVVFVFVMFIKSVGKLLRFNSDKALTRILQSNDMTCLTVFEDNSKFVKVSDPTWKTLSIFGGITILLHLVAFPIARAADGTSSDVSFSIAPILGMFMIILGVAASFGLKFFNDVFSGEISLENAAYIYSDDFDEISATSEENISDAKNGDDNDNTVIRSEDNNGGDNSQSERMFCDF